MSASNGQTEDSLEQLIADIFAMTRMVPNERLKPILDHAFQPSRDVSCDFRVTPTSSQMNNVLKRKKTKRHKSIGHTLTIGLFVSAFVVAALVFGALKAGQVYYGQSEVFYVAVQLLNSPVMTEFLPIDSNSNIANYLQTAVMMIVRWMRTLSVDTGLYSLGEQIQSRLPCVISNPLFVEQESEKYPCSMCGNVEYIRATKDGVEPQPAAMDVLLGPQPIIFRKWGISVTLTHLQELVLTNLHVLDTFNSSLFSNVDYIRELQDLASKEVISKMETDPGLHLLWHSEHYMTSHILRKLFGRPKLIPPEMMIDYRKSLFVDGPDSPIFQLSSLISMENQLFWYAQGAGSRTVVLAPRDDCLTVCPTLSARLRPSDILVFSPNIWTAHSLPSENSTSLALIGQFG